MNELKILAAIMQSREAFTSVAAHQEKGDFSDLAELVFKEIALYYKKDTSAPWADAESILKRLVKQYPKSAAQFDKCITNLPTEVSVANILDDWRDVKREAIAEAAGAYLVQHSYDKAQPLLDRYIELTTKALGEGEDAPKIFIDAEADDFTDSLKVENRIAIAPTALNDDLGGGLTRGGHLLFYGPPEVGKTAAAINTAFGCCTKGHRTMYFGNEETQDMYLNRLLCRFCRWSLSQVLADKAGAMQLARSRGWANLIFVHLSPGTVPQVQELILEHNPDVVVVDQLPNLILGKGKEPEKTQKLETLAYVMRMFYSKHMIAGISMSQASEDAIGKRYLTIKHVYYSNIGVQGQTDAMVGIGMSPDCEAMGRRTLCITKNKLGGPHSNIDVDLINDYSMLRGR